MIDLAPHHKAGLAVANPILLGAGAIGYGEARPQLLKTAELGAVVVGPVLLQSRGGAPLPRLVHTPGGAILNSGLQNRGVQNVIARFAELWPRLGCPVLVQIAESVPQGAAKVASRLAETGAVHGFELLIPRALRSDEVATLVRAVVRAGDLPVWVKVAAENGGSAAEAAMESGAGAIVVGRPPLAGGYRDGQWVQGELLGPAVFAQMLPVLAALAKRLPDAPLIAAGGIHAIDQVNAALATGARAVQLDSVVWVEPGAAGRILARMGKNEEF